MDCATGLRLGGVTVGVDVDMEAESHMNDLKPHNR
jgi:hypothetical protein